MLLANLFVLFFATAQAAPNLNLIDESSRLKVLQEETVQENIPTSRRMYGLGFVNMSAKKLNVFANDRLVSYKDTRRPGVSGELGYFPLQTLQGYFGLTTHLAYSYGELDAQLIKTSLHWLAADVSLIYRYERTAQALVKPFIALGAGYNILLQRGPSYYNTSEARGVGVGTLGLNLNLNRSFYFKSPLMYELTAQYRRVIDNADTNLDFNGEHFALGLEVAL